jgi:NAD(P)-dependent dehydrogenase (short-subunit alcohol dehydrogenase family)
MKLEGKIAILTGASRGIGREIALGFASEGADVVVCARDELRLQHVASEIEQLGRRAIVVGADVSTEVSGFNILVNAMSPGFLKTDMNPEGTRPASDAVPTAVLLASLADDGPNGRFYRFEEELEVISDLSSLDWQK